MLYRGESFEVAARIAYQKRWDDLDSEGCEYGLRDGSSGSHASRGIGMGVGIYGWMTSFG